MIPGSANALLLASAAAGGYQISRSLRFNSIDSAYLGRTPASAGNRQSWTWSGWVKRSNPDTGARQVLFSAYGASNDTGYFEFGFDNGANLGKFYWSQWTVDAQSTAVFRDFSAWYHIVVNYNGSNIVVYVNGTSVLTSAKTGDLAINGTFEHGIGRQPNSGRYFSGYLADIHFIDGQALTPSSFTEVSATTGQLIPKQYTGSFGTNGFWLKFSDNSAATATTLGKDYSGNSNNWTPNNLSVTAGAGNDSLVDTPTSYGTDTGAGGEVRGNYATLNQLDRSSNVTLANGNFDWSNSSAGNVRGTVSFNGGKFYCEATASTAGNYGFGIGKASSSLSGNIAGGITGVYAWNWNGSAYNFHSSGSYPWSASGSSGDVLQVAIDASNPASVKLFLGRQNTWYDSSGGTTANPATGANPTATLTDNVDWFLFTGGANTTNAISVNMGARPFAYTAPSGFKALCDTNLPAPVVAKPNTAFDAVPYTGSSGSQNITTNFSPDLVWVKTRNSTTEHELYDTVRGAGVRLSSNVTLAENNLGANGLTSFNSNGFTVPSTANYGINGSGYTYAAWAWDAGTTTSSNGSGSITSQVRANPSAGFSVLTVSPGTSTQVTIGHGLGVAPGFIFMKQRNSAGSWHVWHSSFTTSEYLFLNSTAAKATSTNLWGTSLPTSTVFGFNIAAGDWVGYAWAPVAGYSSAFTYTGNQSEDGPMVYLGFRPRWIWIKSSTQVDNHYIYDTARATYNQTQQVLNPNGSNAEDTTSINFIKMDILSNGFKVRANQGSGINASGQTYVGFAFAENPFQYARAR